MVKAYLRYDGAQSIGIITSRECNIAVERTGKFALTGCTDAVGVWSVRQATQVRLLKTTNSIEKVTRVTLKQSESICAVGYADGTVRIWNYETSALLQTLQGHKSSIACLAFNKNGHLLASGSSDTDIVLWDMVSETGVARLRGHIDQVTSVLFWELGLKSANSEGTARIISSSKDRFIRIWSIELQLCLQTIAEHKLEVWCLALNSSQTRLVAGSSDKFLRLWSLSQDSSGRTEEPLATFLGAVPRPSGQGNAIALEFGHIKGLDFDVLLCQGAGKTLEVFRCFEVSDVKRRQKRRKKRASIKKQKAGEKRAIGSNLEAEEEEVEDKAQADELADKQDDDAGTHAADELTALTSHRCGAKVHALAWCDSLSMAILSLTNNSLETAQMKAASQSDEASPSIEVESPLGVHLPGHRTAVRSMAVAHDDSLLMTTSAEAVKIWSASTGKCVRTMESGYGLCCFFVEGNEHAVVGTKEGHLELYGLNVGELLMKHEAHTGAIYGLAETPDHKGFVSCSSDKHLRFFELAFTTGGDASPVTFAEHIDQAIELPDEGLAVAYSANGKWVGVALLNHTLNLYFADTRKFYLSLYGHRLPVMCMDISSDSQMLASGSADKNVKLWSMQFGNCHRSLRAHEESVMQVRFLPGTHYLATAGRDRDLKLWDCDSYELITTLKGHTTEILALALSVDAAFIVTAGGDRQIRFWRRSQEQLFLSEERAKELEDRFEQEVEREDLQGGQVVALRPSRRTVESVRTTERLIEILDSAKAEANGDSPNLSGQQPCVRVVQYVNTLTAANIYEVLLCLPFSHALILLQFLLQFFQAVSALAAVDDAKVGQSQSLSAVATLETPCQAALITAYVHHSELAMTASSRTMLLQMRQQMRSLLQAEKDRIGLNVAGFAHLRRSLKSSAGFNADALLTSAAPAAAKAKAKGKKRKR